jgi:hypothetical protein
MDFSNLQSTVNGQYEEQNKTFNFNAAPFSSTAMNELSTNVIKQTSWALTNVNPPQVDTANQTITLSGQCSKFYSYDNAPLTLIFFLADTEAQLSVKLTLPANWSFTDTFKELAETVFADVGFESNTSPLYVFASAGYVDAGLENGSFFTGLNFYGKIIPVGDGVFVYLKDIIGSFVNTTAVGPITFNDANQPNMTLTLGLQGSLEKYFPILKNHVEIQLISQFDEKLGDMTGLWVGTTFDFGTNKNLTIGTVLNPWILDTQVFFAQFQNVFLPSPSEFAKDFEQLIGGNDLVSSLPAPYQNNSHLELQLITLGLNTETWEPSSVSLRIGTPPNDPGWDLDGFATIKNVSLFVGVDSPFAKDNSRSLQVIVSGEVDIPTSGTPIQMVANANALIKSGGDNRYEVSAGLLPNTDLTIPIGELLKKYAPVITDAPDISLSELGVDFIFQSPKNHYGFNAALNPAKPLIFKFGGNESLKVLTGKFHLENDSNNGGPGGGVDGSIEIFDINTQFLYEMPGDFKITAAIPEFEINVQKLATGLIGDDWKIPSWFPTITFPKTDLYIAHQGGATDSYVFALRAEPEFGVIVLQVLKTANTWAFVAGLQLGTAKIAAFSSLHFLGGMDDMFSVNELLFVFASADMAGGFQFPPTTDFPNAKGKNITFPNWAGRLKAGFYFYGSMELNTTKSKNLTLVQNMFSLPADLVFTLLVFIGENPEQNAFVQAGMQGVVKIGDNSYATLQGYIGARMEDGEPQFYIEGVIETTITDHSGKQPLKSGNSLTGALDFELTENAAFLGVSMLGSVNFGAITLSNLVIVIGIDFEGIPSLGFAAQIDLKAYNTNYDSSIAFFFDSGDPAKSLFAGSVSDITLGQVLDTIVGVISDNKDKPPAWLENILNQIALKGTCEFPVSSDIETALDTGDYPTISTAFNKAKKLPTTVNFNQSTTMIVSEKNDSVSKSPDSWYITDYPSSGTIRHYQLVKDGSNINVSLEAQFYYCMPPGGGSVTLGPPHHGILFNSGISVSGILKVFMLELEVEIDIETNKGLMADVEILKPLIIIKDLIEITGNQHPDKGPQFSLATYSSGKVSPHLYLDGKIFFLGLTVATTVDISEKGLLLEFSESVGNDEIGAGFEIKTELDSIKDFSFEFSANLHIDKPNFELFNIELGTLDLIIEAGVDFEFGEAGGEFFLKLKDFDFQFGGESFSIPGFDLNLGTDTLEDIPGIIYEAIKNLIWDFLRDVEHWLEWLGNEIIKGVEDIEKVLDEVFHAIASVWTNDKRIVIAIHESFSASNSGKILITPQTPTNGVTQEMIDDAHRWAEQALENLVTQAVTTQIKQTPPEDIADFKVNVVQNINETFTLDENQTWLMQPQGYLPTLAALGYKNPFSDNRFYTQTQTGNQFEVTVSIADFDVQVIKRVTVSLRYNGNNIGKPYIFTSKANHKFTAPWVEEIGTNYQLQYTVSYSNAKPDITSPWLNEKGEYLNLIIPI